MLGRVLCCFTIIGGALSSDFAAAQIVGDSVDVVNTFEDGNAATNFTGGLETYFQGGSATVADPGVELALFATIYDLDFTEDGLTMTFQNNDSVGVELYGDGTFDRYYIGFDQHYVDSISIDPGQDNNLTPGLMVEPLPRNFQLDVADLFGSGVALPISFPNGGFVIEFGLGSDYSDSSLGQSVSFSFTTTEVPEPTSGALLLLCGLSCGMIRRAR